MLKWEDFDIERGFVLEQEDALKYLKWLAGCLWERATGDATLGEAVDTAKEEWEDLACMAQRIHDEDIEWVYFTECQMSASGINIAEMVRKERDEK